MIPIVVRLGQARVALLAQIVMMLLVYRRKRIIEVNEGIRESAAKIEMRKTIIYLILIIVYDMFRRLKDYLVNQGLLGQHDVILLLDIISSPIIFGVIYPISYDYQNPVLVKIKMKMRRFF